MVHGPCSLEHGPVHLLHLKAKDVHGPWSKVGGLRSTVLCPLHTALGQRPNVLHVTPEESGPRSFDL